MGLLGLLLKVQNKWHCWRRFKDVSGVWPVLSMCAYFLSVPLVFMAALYGFLVGMFAAKALWVVYLALVAAGLVGAGVWYGLNRLAMLSDVSRAMKGVGRIDAQELQELLQ